MKILVACDLPDFALDELRGLATVLSVEPALTAETLPARLGDTAILIVDNLFVSEEAFAAGKSLQMIVRAGTDVSNIRVDEASAMGVFVLHTPFREAAAIAEYMLAGMMVLDRGLAPRAADAPPRGSLGLFGRSLGILRMDETGRELASRALSLGMRVASWNPRVARCSWNLPGVELYDWARDLVRRSDYLAAFAPSDSHEDLYIDAELLADVRDNACLAFVGNAGALDEVAVADCVQKRGLRVALDLWPPEGASETFRFRSPLLDLPGVICGVRQANRTQQAREAIAEAVVQRVRSFVVQGQIVDCVNLLERSGATWQLVLRLRDAVGVMAGVMDAVRADGINAEEITCRVFTGARAAWSAVALNERPSTEALEAIRRLPGVLHLELRAVV